MAKVGDRIGAVLSMNVGTAKLLGYGTYAGEHVPEESVGGMGKFLREHQIPNPKIELDSGEVVYGCEWGPEEQVKKKLESLQVENVSIDAIRAEHKSELQP
jgi:hypothetical protein